MVDGGQASTLHLDGPKCSEKLGLPEFDWRQVKKPIDPATERLDGWPSRAGQGLWIGEQLVEHMFDAVRILGVLQPL